MDDLIKDFLQESRENLDHLDQDFVKLESEPDDPELLKSIFRTIHTIKGTCGFLGFGKLESLAHAGENLLSQLRDGAIALNAQRTTVLLQMVDAVREMLDSIEARGNEGERDDCALIATLTTLQCDGEVETHEERGQTRETSTAEAAMTGKPEVVSNEAAEAESGKAEGFLGEAVRLLGKILVERNMAAPEEVAAAIQKQLEGDTRPLGEILVERGAVKTQDVVAALQVQQSAKAAMTEGTIRVDVGLLDKLMNLVGELVLARNHIVQYMQKADDHSLAVSSQRLNLITTELQESVMKTRMQPIGNLWSKFPRTVRDLAMSCGKQVRIEMEGKDTELDKTIVEAIKDPLTHLVRNAVDHGIEAPEKRTAAGKGPEGMLHLRAYHEGGQVNIEISDDGAGLDAEKIRKKALQRGLIRPEQVTRLTERETANLIFLPGLSTAEKVSSVSGRGVGMDVVKTNIEKIGGTVDVQSKAGQGTTVRMKIPLTLAIIPALIVSAAEERYAIPQVSLLELVWLEGENARKGIEMLSGAPVYRLRGQLLPLVYLEHELNGRVEGKPEGARTKREKGEAVNIVVLQAEDRQFGLVVDEINDTEEIVVKPLSKQLKSVNAFAGATIMGDGQVALILDVMGLAQRASVIGENRERAMTAKDAATSAEGGEKQTMLLMQCGAEGRLAMQLSLVARLEEFKKESIEKAGDQQVVQYRGEIMPLLRVADVLGGGQGVGSTEGAAMTQVVVYSEGGRRVGLVVDRILDIVEESFLQQHPSKRKGLIGSAVIQEKVTDLLDVHSLIRSAIPSFDEGEAAGEEK
ncbi:MAG TPA: chemotaxis protein CheW [Dongiaceae bacterium]|nr:chemotaxis protein CheW [Dongiaceae bacterium]